MPGEIVLYGGFVAFIAALILCFFIIVKGRDDLKFLHYNALKAGFAFLSISFLLLIYYLISDSFSIYYVWLYSSRDMPLLFKFAAVWAGQQGSFLFWTWLGSISLLLLSSKKDRFAERTLLISECVVLFLYLLTIATEPFKLMSQFPHLAGTPVNDGAGLDPELLSIWMVIHPPITFIAYAAMTIPSAAAFSYFLWGGDWMRLSRRWAQFSWLFFSLGVGLIGGIWTYEAGWGIWTWDASEAGSLFPWLLLTAALHQKTKPETKAALFIATFISILFATFIIRSGLWGSVHEFTETSVSLMLESAIIILTLGFALLIYRYRKKFDFRVSVNALTLAVMMILASIVFIGLSIPLLTKFVGDEASVGAEFYNLACYPFALLLLILLGACIPGKKGVRYGIIAGALSIGLAFVKPPAAFSLINPASAFYQQASSLTKAYASLSLLSAVPPVLFALYAVIRAVRHQPMAVSFIHLGVALLFFGGIFATSFSTEKTVYFEVADIGKTKSLGDYDVKLSGFIVEQNHRGNWVQRANLEVFQKDESLGTATASLIRDPSGNYVSRGIIRTLPADVFITFSGLAPVQDAQPVIPIDVRIYPLLNIFWLGDVMLSAGIILLILRKKIK
ncbi:Cytochrome C assembly protein [uncultured archaeon]|nr:Cytochrome C assembly protein [uncultured archaeon]